MNTHWTMQFPSGFPHGPKTEAATPGTQAFRERVQHLRDERIARMQAERDERIARMAEPK